jgi:serine protease Do
MVPVAAWADPSMAQLAAEIQPKMVKVFGSGGIRGVPHYGTGILVSPEGHILTVYSAMLDTPDLRVHLPDGRRFHAKVIANEPQLDVALLKVDKVNNLPFFDITKEAEKPLAPVGTGVLAFSNLYEVATLSEPVSVQRGVVSSYAKLHGKKGIFDAPFQGEVYMTDAVTNNPGCAGGALTTRKGDLLGILGKEMTNSLTDTWVNYAVPIQAKVEGLRGDQKATVSVAEFVRDAIDGKYTTLLARQAKDGPKAFHGIILVPAPVDRTPPYVEEVVPDSPAFKAGFRPDDLIVYVQGEQVPTVKACTDLLNSLPPETEFKVEVRRGDKLMTLSLTMAPSKDKTPVKPKTPDKPEKPNP